MYKYLEKENEIGFDKIFNQILGKCKCNHYNLLELTSSSELIILGVSSK